MDNTENNRDNKLSSDRKKELVIIAGSVLAAITMIVIVLMLPVASIAALNTLFPVLAIPYTFWTWLSVFFLVFLRFVFRALAKKY